ncbi:unnamed protein product [Mytilus edulis]|uniref:CCHC-type domain-containing protein n=1 Tax=Mytilus edulis TaxID=6550 RepID=A0A8S3TCL7_MYTED|nr:unnamed protein product [Mytilus edulis]
MDDTKIYISNCEYYDITDYTDKTSSITITFATAEVFQILSQTLFNKIEKSLFENRHKNGLVHETKFENRKVVLHLHESTKLLHIQGGGCILWFENIFKSIGKEIHEKFKNNSPNLQRDDQDESETDPKQMLENTESLLSDTILSDVMYTSAIEISCGYGKPKFMSTPQTNRSTSGLCHHENSELIQSLITRINDLTEQCNTLADQVSNLSALSLQNIKSTNTMETQTMLDINESNINIRMTHHMGTQTEPEYTNQPIKIIKESVLNVDNLSQTETYTVSTNYSKPLPMQKINNSKQERRVQPRHARNDPKETLIIGSSILQRIRTRGLKKNTAVKTIRGANTSHIRHELENMDLKDFKTFFIQVGGNDASNKRDPELVECEFVNMIDIIRKTTRNARIILAECPPRRDANVKIVNHIIGKVAESYDVECLQTVQSFIRQNGHLNSEQIWRDGIHLTDRGTATLLRLYDTLVKVTKEKSDTTSLNQNNSHVGVCFFCGEEGHNSRFCRHETKILCWTCSKYGHKMKNCWYSSN